MALYLCHTIDEVYKSQYIFQLNYSVGKNFVPREEKVTRVFDIYFLSNVRTI
jgi:hypothetical protein